MKTTQTANSSCPAQNPVRNGSAIAVADLPTTTSDNARVCEATISSTQHGSSASVASRRTLKLNVFLRHLRWFLSICVLLALVAFGAARYLAYAHAWVKTDNAYLATHIHSVSARVAGTVKEVLVTDNQLVAAGTVLARLDPRDFQVRLQQAAAQVSAAHAQIRVAEAQIGQARAQVTREQARATKARADLTRAQSLYQSGSGAISKQEFDLASAEAASADAALEAVQSALESATASLGAAQAQEQLSAASLQEAELQLSYTDILAPVAGRIGKKNLEVGNRLQAGQPVLALVQNRLWVTANFKETQLARLKPGQFARIRVDAFPGISLRGTVDSLSPASGAEFALLPPDNATGNFTRIVQRVPVKVELDSSSLSACEGRLASGMSAVVEVRVND